MIKEVVEKILTAEAEADAMIAEAMSQARQMNVDAEVTADGIIAKAKADVKADRQAVQKQAEADANAQYEQILNIGQNEAGKMINSINVAPAVEQIVKAFKEKYGSC